MKNAKEILEALYKVYDPKEIEENPDVLNEPFNSQEIRNIMMSYFMFNTLEDTLKGIREIINKMPDEWVVEFLKNQENTVVEKIGE